MNKKIQSHGEDHVREVLARAREINVFLYQTLGICGDINIIETAVKYHDIAADINRKHHHILGAEMFKKEYQGKIPGYKIKKITNCIREHRASYAGEYSSLEAQIVSTADRDNICTEQIKDLFERSYIYAREHGKEHDEAVLHSYHHIKEKYGREGYAFNPNNKVFFIYYKDDIEKFWNAIDLVYLEYVIELLKDLRDLPIKVISEK